MIAVIYHLSYVCCYVAIQLSLDLQARIAIYHKTAFKLYSAESYVDINIQIIYIHLRCQCERATTTPLSFSGKHLKTFSQLIQTKKKNLLSMSYESVKYYPSTLNCYILLYVE